VLFHSYDIIDYDHSVTVIDLFDVVCLRCNDGDVVTVELFILRWLIIGINFIDKQHEVFLL